MNPFSTQFRIKNETENLRNARRKLSSSIRRTNLSRSEKNRVIVAVDEAITNIMEHAYENNLEAWIDVEIKVSDDKVRITLQDSGKSFDPDTFDEPDLREHLDKGKKKGFGVFLINQIMDEVRICSDNEEKNEMQLVKFINDN